MSTDDIEIDDEHPDLAAIETEADIEALRDRCRKLFRYNGKLLDEKKKAVGRVRELEAIEIARHAKPDSELSARERFLRDAEHRLAKLSGSEYDAALAELHQEAGERAAAEGRREEQARRDALTADYRETRRKHEALRLIGPLAHPDCASLLASHTEGRIGLEEGEDGTTTITYKGKDGRPCSAEDLVAELRSDPGLAPLIRGGAAAEKAAHAKRVAETLGIGPAAKH
jgi:hypothetical protein